VYSSRSRLSSFVVGDQVIFHRIRDWNDRDSLIEMRGVVVGKGRDPEIGVNFIEVRFEVESFSGVKSTEIRRFTVK
jgi:hypothetical protein